MYLGAGELSLYPAPTVLAENADFAQAATDAGLTWIGPAPQAIRDPADKVTARRLAAKAGAPLVPGTCASAPGDQANGGRTGLSSWAMMVALSIQTTPDSPAPAPRPHQTPARTEGRERSWP
jgi:pyruvate carboxylase